MNYKFSLFYYPVLTIIDGVYTESIYTVFILWIRVRICAGEICSSYGEEGGRVGFFQEGTFIVFYIFSVGSLIFEKMKFIRFKMDK